MLTLDDVIDNFEKACDLELRCENCSGCLSQENGYWKLPMLPETGNDPLTWDELKKMEGKPIWIELLKGSWKGWDVVGGFTDDDFGEAMVTVRLDDYYKVDLGKMWQAYRKERK